VSLDHLDRFPQLRSLRVSCMPAPHVGFASDALWRLVVPTAITRLRYQFLNDFRATNKQRYWVHRVEKQ